LTGFQALFSPFRFSGNMTEMQKGTRRDTFSGENFGENSGK